MRKFSNTEAELKKNVAYKKTCTCRSNGKCDLAGAIKIHYPERLLGLDINTKKDLKRVNLFHKIYQYQITFNGLCISALFFMYFICLFVFTYTNFCISTFVYFFYY